MFRTPAKAKQPEAISFEDVEFESSPSFSSLSPSPLTSRPAQQKKKVVSLKFSPPPKKTIQAVAGPSKDPANKTYTKRTPPKETQKVAARDKREDRMFEARECLEKFNEHLSNSKNLKTEIKQGVSYATKRIFTLLTQCNRDLGDALEALAAKTGKDPVVEKQISCKEVQTEMHTQEPVRESEEEARERIQRIEEGQAQLVKRMEEQTALLQRSLESVNNLEQVIQKCKPGISEGSTPEVSYASVAAAKRGGKPPVYRTLHSVAITSKKDTNTADDTLKEVRKALNAKEGGVEVERVRKSRDGRVIISCRTTEERDRLTHKLLKEKKDLTAENIANKKPMVMITGVLRIHTDEDLFRALKNQNKLVFEGLEKVDEGMEVAYKIRGRNPNTHRVVLKVTPPIWKRLTEAGTVRIDLQTLQVTDRSPLTQCTICLGFGHGKKLCTESQVMCSHCGGPHTRSECEEHIVGAQPKCKNCVREKRAETGHNAFSEICPVRSKWDAIVRATVAYE
ncbi:hypothetical protein K1T71_012486 [Dendrolimus kikuchii]|uniref:Uncharacterized protein n=1 Tax=Dendrolimus kikuchii TaxID=765133 RepID=A0ACC1CJG1_9NEOP|nr:hypothetical protein K1T71_012486 [Dendrolimus kikuchii]